MSIIDELREYALSFKNSHGAWSSIGEKLDHVADRIDAAHEEALVSSYFDGVFSDGELAENGFIRLPKDADGEVIHVGDMMEYGKSRGHVIALMLSEYPKKWGGGLHWGIQLEGEQAPTALDGFFRHHHPDTWERIIEDATALGAQMGRRTKQVDDLVARCKALADDRKEQ